MHRHTAKPLQFLFSSVERLAPRCRDRSSRIGRTQLFAFVILSSACRGSQSALDPAGLQSERLEDLWWLFFAITGVVYLIVMAVLAVAFVRARRNRKLSDADTQPVLTPDPQSEKRIGNVIKGAIAVTVVILFVFMVASFQAGREINALYHADDPINIRITGRQWWWEVEYQDALPSRNVLTANEIHVPVGRPVKFELQSTDVIHSFWVPNLHGKKDLVPGYKTSFVFQADRPGTYWGQCAEFCGHQHAKMRFIVVAESEQDFNNWYNGQLQTPAPPTTEQQLRGQQIFLTTTCTQCHTVQGTPASARVGPNLTHIAGRSYLAAGSLENTREHLGSWIIDPQKTKPGIRMPMHTYSNEDLNALVDYLQSLK